MAQKHKPQQLPMSYVYFITVILICIRIISKCILFLRFCCYSIVLFMFTLIIKCNFFKLSSRT